MVLLESADEVDGVGVAAVAVGPLTTVGGHLHLPSVGQDHRDRPVKDVFACAQDRVAQPQGLVLHGKDHVVLDPDPAHSRVAGQDIAGGVLNNPVAVPIVHHRAADLGSFITVAKVNPGDGLAR